VASVPRSSRGGGRFLHPGIDFETQRFCAAKTGA